MDEGRIDRLETRVSELEVEVRRLAAAPAPVTPAPAPTPVPIAATFGVSPTVANMTPAAVAAEAEPRSQTSLESLIAGRGLQITGALLVLLGCAYFLDLAFTRGWIGPAERIVLGLAAGAGIILFASRRFGKAYASLAEALIGLGAGVDYLSLWASVHSFPELGVAPAAAFAGMIAVTAALGALAATRRSQNVALFGAVGGFLTPVLLAGGSDDRVILAAYIGVLAAGMTALAARYRFAVLEVLTVLAVLAYTGSFAPNELENWSVASAQITATAFFLIFAIAVSLGTVSTTDRARKVSLLALCTGSYALVLEVLFAGDRTVLGIDQLVLSCALLGAAQVRKLDRAIAQTYGYLSLGTITLALVAFVHGTALLDALIVEATILFTVGLRSRDGRLIGGAIGVLALLGLPVVENSLVRPATDWVEVTIGNAVWIAAAAYALFAAAKYAKHPDYAPGYALARICFDAAVVVALSRACLDLFGRGTTWFDAASSVATFAISLVWTAYASGLFWYGLRVRVAQYRWEALVLFGCTVLKVFSVDLSSVGLEWRVLSFVVLGAVLFAISALYTRSMSHPAESVE